MSGDIFQQITSLRDRLALLEARIGPFLRSAVSTELLEGVLPLHIHGGTGGGGIMDVAVDAGGRIWCIVHDTSSGYTVTDIYYSDDDGDNWTQACTYGNGTTQIYQAWRILPHPTNQNIIAIVGTGVVGLATGFILYTLDRGVTWGINYKSGIQKAQVTVDQCYDALMLPNGRIMWLGLTGANSRACQYSDNWGQAWTTAWSVSSSYVIPHGLYRSASGSTVAFIIGTQTGVPYTVRLYLSSDGGATFTEQSLAIELETFVGVNAITLGGRYAYSPAPEAIYVTTDQTKDVCKLTPISAAGIWSNLTDAYPHAAQGSRNLCVIPR